MPKTPDCEEATGRITSRALRTFPRLPLSAVLCFALIAAASVTLFLLSDNTADSADSADSAKWLARTLEPPAPSTMPSPREKVDQNVGYLGPDSCAECHSDRVSEFRLTNHFRTCRIPVAGEMPPQFHTGPRDFITRFDGLRFEMSQRGDKFFQTTVQSKAAGDERVESRIDLVLGAGRADDVYLTWPESGRMYELPVAWLWSDNSWGASHFLTAWGTQNYSRAMTVRCLECHNTWMDYEPGTVNKYRHGTEITGVTCERCHGPGATHVAWHQTNPGETVASSIIRPSDLSRERLIETCTQCHSNATVHRQTPFSYRPGEPLEEFFRTLTIDHPEDDHVANQIGHLRGSRCFQGSETMTCITCHDPHRIKDLNESPSASCYQCHHTADCLEQPRLPEPVRQDCIGCHMPLRIKINVKFETENDNFVPPAKRFRHDIAVDELARDEVLLRWYRSQSDASSQSMADILADRLVAHWTAMAEQHHSQFRFLAAIADYREALAIRETIEIRSQLQQVIARQQQLYDDWAFALNEISHNRPAAAIETLKSILQTKPDDAEVHSKLGTLYAISGQTDLAVPHLEAVVKFDRNNGSGHGVLGRIAWINRDYQKALKHWRRAEELDPYNAQILFDIGKALERLNRIDESIRSLERATAIDPGRTDIVSELNALRNANGRSPLK